MVKSFWQGFGLADFCEEVVEVDRLTQSTCHHMKLCRVEYITKLYISLCLCVSLKLNGREGHLTLLHVVVDGLVEVLTHVGL